VPTIPKVLFRVGAALNVGVYRRTGGRVGSRARGGRPVLLLTVRGRKSGADRTVPVTYFTEGDGYLVVGSGGGMKTDPQWVRNLAVAPTARIQVQRRRLDVTVEQLRGDERDAVWRDVVVSRAPSFADYERPSGRTIPIFRLQPQPASTG
jgi:deazaflavin-dependent oxidoreductase (nitroreductase family)